MRRRLAAVLLLLAPSAFAVRAPEPGVLLPEADVRTSSRARLLAATLVSRGAKPDAFIAGPARAPSAMQLTALAELEREVGALEVRWDDITGSPSLLFARQGLLSPPDGRAPAVIARDFLASHAQLFGLLAEDISDLRVAASVPATGATVVLLSQEHRGLRVMHGQAQISVTKEGRIAHVSAGLLASTQGLTDVVPQRDPSEALVALASLAGVPLTAPPSAAALIPGGAQFRSLPGVRNKEVTVQSVIVASARGPRLAWTTDLAIAGSPAWYDVTVDDATLQPIRRSSRTDFLDTRGRIFASSPQASPHELVRFYDTADYRSDISSLGWANETGPSVVSAGNNVFVQDDIANDDELTPGRQATAAAPAPFRAFDFTYTGGSAADADASLTNLFYGINSAHDRFQELGFDEASGNFQTDNRSLGGLGGDAVLADDMDGSGTNNANFQTPPDGLPGRMQMFLWDISGSVRSSSFDVGVIIHELGHGVSTRLVGGPQQADCLFGQQGGSMGEAWSDYFAASFLQDPVVGAYVSGNPDGIRMFRLDENPATGKDYRDFCTYANDTPPQICEPHDNGEIWSGFLWRVREEYIALHGADGAGMADQLVMDGMKFTPCNPSMLDARDGLILADRVATGGQHECLIKEVAREKYMGFGASSAGTSDTSPVTSNAPWPECVASGTVLFDRSDLGGTPGAFYGCQDTIRVVVTDGNAVVAPTVTLTALSGDSEDVLTAPGSGPGSYTGSILTTEVAGTPGDGLLTIVAGDTVTASYTDAAPAGTVTADASITCTPQFEIVRHRIVRATCDDDAVNGFPELPGFLDRGESADIEIAIRNQMPIPLRGAATVTTNRPDLVTVLPSSPIPVDLPARMGTSPAEIVLILRLAGSDTIAAGDVATLSISLAAPGFTAPVPVDLVLELDKDYEVVSGLTETFDIEGETAPVGPAWTSGTLEAGTNEWKVVTCANTTPAGTKAFRNGPANCAGRYTDAQGNPWLASPALNLLGPGTRAVRITRTAWQNDIDLGVAGFPPFVPNAVDADAVAVVATNDPTVFDATNPLAIATTALAFYIKVDIPDFVTIDSNTNGFVLDQRDVLPGQLTGVDLSQPTHLAWYFLPDITFVQPGLEAQGEGYYLDDVTVTFERVNAIEEPSACAAEVTPFSFPIISQPTGASACGGDAVTVDASRSEVALCGGALELRFLVDGVPVACFEDATGTTPRTQDVDGWGDTTICVDFPLADTRYDVEVRCDIEPRPSDTRSTSVRIVDGLPVISGTPRAFCAGSGTAITLDAAASSLVGCSGDAEFLFTSNGNPLDCDGDTTPDGYRADATCLVGPSDVDLDVTVSVRCSTLTGCALTDTFTIPAVSVTADLTDVAPPPGNLYCEGASAALSAAGSTVNGCAGGQSQYRFTTLGGFDSGWTSIPLLDLPVTADDTVTVEVRCSLNPDCVSSDTLPVALRTGVFGMTYFDEPDDCAGDYFELNGSTDLAATRCDAPATVEYRFLQDTDPGPGQALVVVACATDLSGASLRAQDVDGWAATRSCFTPHIAGGGTFLAEFRCSADPTCTLDQSTARTVVPQTGIPAGTNPGTLRVRKSGPGCPVGGDVLLSWANTDYMPQTFVTQRADDPAQVLAAVPTSVDGFTATDAGAACDGGGVPFRQRLVYFYLHSARNTCTGQPIP